MRDYIFVCERSMEAIASMYAPVPSKLGKTKEKKELPKVEKVYSSNQQHSIDGDTYSPEQSQKNLEACQMYGTYNKHGRRN